MAGTFSYVRPDELWSLAATVTTIVGATDSTYTDDWLVDGRSGRPAKATNGTVTWSLAAAAGEVGCIAICNHNIDAARTITIGGGISSTLTGPPLPPDGIRLNPVIYPTPTSVTALTVGIASNSVAVIIGEVLAGKLRTCRAVRYEADFSEDDHSTPMQVRSLQPYDPAQASRAFSGVQVYTTAQRDEFIDWMKAQRAGSKPSLLIPDTTVQDAWVVKLEGVKYRPKAPNLWEVSLSFTEYPRERW